MNCVAPSLAVASLNRFLILNLTLQGDQNLRQKQLKEQSPSPYRKKLPLISEQLKAYLRNNLGVAL